MRRSFGHFRTFSKRFSNVALSNRCIASLAGATTVFSAAGATLVHPQNEQRIESSTKNASSSLEQQSYEQMLDVLDSTSSKLQDLFAQTQASSSSSSQSHASALPLDASLHSEYLDFYDKIDLIFTEDEPDTQHSDNMRARMERLVRATQEHFCHEIQQLEGDAATFQTDLWKRPASRCGSASKHAGGLSKVLVNGKVFEKAGVSVSVSSGKLPKRAVQQMTADHQELQKLLV